MRTFDWSSTPASWADLGKRVAYELHLLAAAKQISPAQAHVTALDVARALDDAWNGITPQETIAAWVATRTPAIPEVGDGE